jgi:predicted NAD/FAD-dependent oxidoreductase
MLGYETRPEKRPYYALVNTDKKHPISWLAWEHEKSPERVPPGAGLLIAQMAPQFTLDHWNNKHEQTVEDVHQLVVELIDEPLDTPVFGDVYAWACALPVRKANADTINAIAFPHRLAFCGDGYVGGRVHLALENGIRVAHQIIQGHVEEKQE